MDSEDYFERVLEELLENCLRGILHYKIWQEMADFLRDKEDLLERYDYFWGQSVAAHIGMAKLYLIKIFDRSGSSIDVNSLLKRAKENTEILKHEKNPDELLNNMEGKLGQIQHIIDNLKEIRDKHFVHLSRKHLEDYSELYKINPVKRKQIKEALDICSEVLNGLNVAFRDTSLLMAMPEEDHTTFLLTDLHVHIKDCMQQDTEGVKDN